MKWGFVGPDLVTKLFQTYCFGEIIHNSNSTFQSCKDITILPVESLHVIPWNNILDLFKKRKKEHNRVRYISY